MATLSSSASAGATRRSWLQRLAGRLRLAPAPVAAAPGAGAAPGGLAFRPLGSGLSYVGEICIIAGTYAPAGWMLCDGRTLQIAEYETLFNLIGTIYGGDGQETFGLPDLRGRVPMHQNPGANYVIGGTGGDEVAALTSSAQLPTHTHTLGVSSGPGTTASPQGSVPAKAGNGSAQYTQNTSSLATQSPQTLGSVGGGSSHPNMQPYQAVNYAISLFGIFPSQT